MDRRKFLKKYLHGRTGAMAGMILATIFAAFLNLVSPLIFSFFIDNVIDGQPVSGSLMTLLVKLAGGTDYLRRNLWIGGILIVLVYLLFAWMLYLRGKLSGDISEGMSYDLRNDLYTHLQQLPYSYHVKAKTGDLVQRCTSDVDQIRRVFANQIYSIVNAVMTVVVACIVLFSINWKLAWLAVACMPALFFYALIYFRKMQKVFLESDESEGRLTAAVQESLSGIRVIKAFGRERYETDRFDGKSREYRDITFGLIRRMGAYWATSDFICMLQTLMVVIAGIFAARAGTLSIGSFVVFISYESMILWPVRQLGRTLSDIGKAGISIDRLNEIFNEPVEDLVSGDRPEITGDIQFSHVYFRYDDGNEDVLKDVSMHIPAGRTIAVIGPTGSGKSSLVHLLSRLYDYTGGSVKIDGHELRDINREYLRSKVGIVLQEPFLFSKTIYENISLANRNADRKAVERAAQIADVHNVIEEFEQGYDTLVGEKGVTLSGGQKQRIAIARTILNDNRILVFDDSLSAVDTETDAAIRRSLQGLRKGVTTIIITQRISSAQDADEIFVLEQGRITQHGTHAQLIREEGLYQRVYKIQESYVKGGAEL
jgi:ATP-binding cassette subfamily B protein